MWNGVKMVGGPAAFLSAIVVMNSLSDKTISAILLSYVSIFIKHSC